MAVLFGATAVPKDVDNENHVTSTWLLEDAIAVP